MRKKIKPYSVSPAKGQALLSYDGRRAPEKLPSFETETVEEVRRKAPAVADDAAFRNLLIQGDCLSACAYLKQQGVKIDLVYIDPPFASGANYAKTIHLRNGGKTAMEANDNSIGEEVMYGDIWQKEDYLNWIYERLLAIREVMSETASIYVHLDWHIGHYVKILMDEVFGEGNFINEVIWSYKSGGSSSSYFSRKHDNLLLYSMTEKYIFNVTKEKSYNRNFQRYNFSNVEEHKDKLGWYTVVNARDVWEIDMVGRTSEERQDYATQKPCKLLKRIIQASSNENMIVADFFSGSGTAAKVANELNRKFIACDIGINALQTTRDRLAKAQANFDVIKIKDGLRLFRNPAQTTAKIFSVINGYKSRNELELGEFWDGGVAKTNGAYAPIKFCGIHEVLNKKLLDVYLQEIYQLEDAEVEEVVIIYAHKEEDINQQYINQKTHKDAKTELKVTLRALDDLLGEKRDAFYAPDNADIKIKKEGERYEVGIRKFYSPYLSKKLDDYNAKKTKRGTLEENTGNVVTISDAGLELIESVQFDTTLAKTWQSDPALEDKAGIKEKIKGVYLLNTNKFKLKIRNIAGDELLIDSDNL